MKKRLYLCSNILTLIPVRKSLIIFKTASQHRDTFFSIEKHSLLNKVK